MECAIASEWVIDEEELRKEDGWIDGPIIKTTIPDVQYNVTVFVNYGDDNDDDDDESKIAFYLYLKTKMPITGKYMFSIPYTNFSQTLTYLYDPRQLNDNGYGKHAFSRDFFFDPKNGFFQNGKLTLQLHGTLKYEKTDESKRGKSIGQLFWADDGKDFTIEVNGKEIMAHKFILRKRSPYFAAMFDSEMTEARENKVKIEGFPFIIVEAAIKICYDSEVDHILSIDEHLLLLKFADVYDIGHVKSYIESYVADIISPLNVCRFAISSVEFHADNIRLCCLNFLVKCKKDVSAVTDFDSLDVNFKADFASKIMCSQN